MKAFQVFIFTTFLVSCHVIFVNIIAIFSAEHHCCQMY